MTDQEKIPTERIARTAHPDPACELAMIHGEGQYPDIDMGLDGDDNPSVRALMDCNKRYDDEVRRLRAVLEQIAHGELSARCCENVARAALG